MSALVSIITPTYNAAEYIRETIRSVQAQTYTNWELIIVDDCSTDNTEDIVKEYLVDERIRYVKTAENSGAAKTRNTGIRLSKGKWIAFLDSDDLWEENKLSKHIDFMQREKLAFSFTSYNVINDRNQIISKFEPKKDRYDYKDILKHCYIGCSTAIYDSEALGKVEMPEAAIKREDFACWLQILKMGISGGCLHENLTRYRIREKSVSSNKFKMIKYQWNVYRKIEELSVFKSVYYLSHWAIRGIFKYR